MICKYKNATDDELLLLINESDEDALNFLLDRYKPIVKIKARMYFLVGGDTDDLIQEGMIGLFNAIKKYDKSVNTRFKTFAEICVDNQIKTALRNNNRLKHSTLNDSISIEKFTDFSLNEDDTPLQMILSNENYNELVENMNNTLTGFEKQVLYEYLQGNSRSEIAYSLEKGIKSIDNCLFRIRRKISDFYGKDKLL